MVATLDEYLKTLPPVDDLSKLSPEELWRSKIEQSLATLVKQTVSQPIKGNTVHVFNHQAANYVSDIEINMQGFNALHVDVIVTGSNPSATVSVINAGPLKGLGIALPDSNASQATVTASKSFTCIVGAPFVSVRLTSYTGGVYDVWVTPYRS